MPGSSAYISKKLWKSRDNIKESYRTTTGINFSRGRAALSKGRITSSVYVKLFRQKKISEYEGTL